jgi:hypothetical protein
MLAINRALRSRRMSLALYDRSPTLCSVSWPSVSCRAMVAEGVPAALSNFGCINAQQSDFLTTETERIGTNDQCTAGKDLGFSWPGSTQ